MGHRTHTDSCCFCFLPAVLPQLQLSFSRVFVFASHHLCSCRGLCQFTFHFYGNGSHDTKPLPRWCEGACGILSAKNHSDEPAFSFLLSIKGYTLALKCLLWESSRIFGSIVTLFGLAVQTSAGLWTPRWNRCGWCIRVPGLKEIWWASSLKMEMVSIALSLIKEEIEIKF